MTGKIVKKIIQIFIMMYILISVGYADIITENMEQYWENSRAQNMFKFGKNNLERDLFKGAQLKKEDTKPPLLKAINTFVNNPKYLREYKNIFFTMDDSVRKDLRKFYQTSLGEKYKKLSHIVENSLINDVKSRYSELIENNVISKEKMRLISNIDKELNLVEIKVDWQRNFIIFQKRELYPNDNITDSMIDRAIKKYEENMKKYESMLMPVLFQNFTKNELKEILKYASSNILTIEVEYIYKALLEFTKLSYTDLKEDYKRLAMISYCQNYPNNRGYIPEDCKKEWLSIDTNMTE